jgi:2-polyprenyl-3-methyl-5-hydroxy-6-metoxy-1,4-benzoquinol methylase
MSTSTQPTISEQKNFWDWHWQHWQDRKTINDWKHKRHEAILEFLGSLGKTNLQILDVGCGPGWYTDKLARFGKVTGLDLSEEAIEMAKARFPHITFIAGNIYDQLLPAKHFDVVVSQEVIDHVEDSFKFLERIERALKPGGHLVLSGTNKFVVDRLTEREFPAQPAQHIGRYFTKAQLKNLVRRRFRLLRIRTIIPVGHGGILRIINSHKLNTLLGRLVPRRSIDRAKEFAGLGYQMIVLAQKSK